MKKSKKKEYLEQIKKVPVVQYACDQIGISRNTFYRWRKSDEKFCKLAGEALAEGEKYINDMTEAQLISLIQDKNWNAMSFWLRTRNPKFSTKVDVNAEVQNINFNYSPQENEQLDEFIEELNQN
jgi:ACT domain-containing protein